jgi:hypothetical protein
MRGSCSRHAARLLPPAESGIIAIIEREMDDADATRITVVLEVSRSVAGCRRGRCPAAHRSHGTIRPWPPEPARDLDAIGIGARGGDHHAAEVDVNRNLRKFAGDGMKERQSFRGPRGRA